MTYVNSVGTVSHGSILQIAAGFRLDD